MSVNTIITKVFSLLDHKYSIGFHIVTMTCMSVKCSIRGNFINNNVIVYLHVGPKRNVGKYAFQEFHHPIGHHMWQFNVLKRDTIREFHGFPASNYNNSTLIN